MTDTGSSSRLYLMEMTEKIQAGSSPSVVKFTMGKDTKQSTLANVDITDDSYSDVNKLEKQKDETLIIILLNVSCNVSAITQIEGH